MCRNIRTLYNFEPPATAEEVRASAVQFVRKVSGFNRPSRVNERAFERAVEEVSQSVHRLFEGLSTEATAKDRDVEKQKAQARSARRFGA